MIRPCQAPAWTKSKQNSDKTQTNSSPNSDKWVGRNSNKILTNFRQNPDKSGEMGKYSLYHDLCKAQIAFGQSSDKIRTNFGRNSDKIQTKLGQTSDKIRTNFGQNSDKNSDKIRTKFGQMILSSESGLPVQVLDKIQARPIQIQSRPA